MDNGYFSAANVQACLDREIEPLIALGREAHHLPLAERFGPDAPEPATDDPVIRMGWRLRTQAGRALYAKRKATVEPVFGIIQHVMGCRQFSLRGLAAAAGEWTLVTLAFNLKRMHVLSLAGGAFSRQTRFQPPFRPLTRVFQPFLGSPLRRLTEFRSREAAALDLGSQVRQTPSGHQK